jgi:hypothetical protein
VFYAGGCGAQCAHPADYRNEGDFAMKFTRHAFIASTLLLATTAFAQVDAPAAPAFGQSSMGTGAAPRSGSVTQRSGAAASTAPAALGAREHTTATATAGTTTADADARAEGAARSRMDAQKRALAPSAGVGVRMETDMAVRR